MSQVLSYPYPVPAGWYERPPVPPFTRLTDEPTARRGAPLLRRAIAGLQAAALGTLLGLALPVAAAEMDPLLQRLATCQDSWLDWRRDEAAMRRFGEQLTAQFRRDEARRVWVPRGPVQWLGQEVSEITPQSVGMGLGFGVTLKAPMTALRAGYEAAVGRALKDCQSGEGLTSCGLELAPKKTAMMVTPTARPQVGTMLGCYYVYEP